VEHGQEGCSHVHFLHREVISVSAVRDSLFNIFPATLHIWRPFLHPQPEDAPCLDDRDCNNIKMNFKSILFWYKWFGSG
jgi:hypothetical protein